MAQENVAIGLAIGGVNAALDPSLLGANQVSKAINCQLDHQALTTRYGSRVLSITGDYDNTLAIQGITYYDPKRGVSAQVFSDDSASFIVAAGGNKYRVFPQRDSVISRDITNGFTQDSQAHLIWMGQAENYFIAGDGIGTTWIFDGEEASYSAGFIGLDNATTSREDSSVPQGVRAPIYYAGRLWVTVDARKVLASDSIHGENQTAASDLIKFVEQVYWATGQYFSPPSSMGNIIAAAVLPQRNTRTGQGELMIHCQNGGIFSINGNIHPRENWSTTPMVNHFLLDTAATGPYALDIQEGDQLFRSRSGIQTLRSAAAESRLLGRPLKPISEEVNNWLGQDHVPYLRYASLINWTQQELLLCTTGPIVDGSHTYHLGSIVLDWDPTDSSQAPGSWLGLWTYPSEYRYIAKMAKGLFCDSERAFGIHRGEDDLYRFVEYSKDLKEDILEDGTTKAIESKVVSREINDGANPYSRTAVLSGSLHFRDVCRTTSWSVEIRNDSDSCWTVWRSGEICFDPCPDSCSLVAEQARNVEIELGKPPESVENGRRLQFQVTWTGWARLEGLVVRLKKSSQDSDFNEERLSVTCVERKVCCDPEDSDYSYSLTT